MMRLIETIPAVWAVLAASLWSCGADHFNVLMIAVDDLRPELGCYGSAAVRTPNMDRLAGQGILFERAYCQQAVCMASRASLFSGLYPEPRNGYNFLTPVGEGMPDIVCLPEFLKRNGYYTVGINKDFHHYWQEQRNWDEHFDSPTPGSDWRNYLSAENQAIQQRLLEEARERLGDKSPYGPYNLPAANSWEMGPDAREGDYIDSHGTRLAIDKLRELKDRRFFLSLGLRKPHLPFNAPKRYFDMYPLEDIRLPDTAQGTGGASPYAFMNSFELRAYSDIPDEGPAVACERQAKELLRAYYACVTYVDDLIGQVLDTLDALGLSENTIVILWGDHGFKLGEHNEWGKHSNFEVDVRAPLILRVPGLAPAGARTRALTEFVDIYPTLAELCGLEPPAHLEGRSLVPLISGASDTHRASAFSRYPRDQHIVGYTVRVVDYRYTVWLDQRDGSVLGSDLFDHRDDPLELRNRSGDASLSDVEAECRRVIHESLAGIRERRGEAGQHQH